MEEQIKEALRIAKENQKKLDKHSNEINSNLQKINQNKEANTFALEIITQVNEGNKKWHSFAKTIAIAFIITLLLLGATFGYLIYVLNDTNTIEETTTISQDNENGYNNYIGNDGEIVNGKTDN